jgi:tRNA pseudouridine55 synthase
MNGVLVVDKPPGKTSHDIVYSIRRIASQKKVGHTGTLDPMATGVLVMLLGKATRIGRFLELEPKEYIADALFGITTDTQDITGNITGTHDGILNRSDIEQVLPEFTGDIEQIPPMVSAIKIKGQTLYKLARRGVEVERPPRHITVHELESISYRRIDYTTNPIKPSTSPGENSAPATLVTFRVTCSGGTYVRTLVHDIGRRLGVGAALFGLRRTRVGDFSIENAIALNKLTDSESVANRLISMNHALHNLPLWIVNYDAIGLLLNGRELDMNFFQIDRFEIEPNNDSWGRLASADGKLIAIGKIKYAGTDYKNAVVKPDIVFGDC